MSKVYEVITNQIIENLNKGIIPWKKPWTGGGPRNWITQKPYRGINMFLLEDGEYMTFKQATDHGGKIKKGSKSHIVTFYKMYKKEEKDEKTGENISHVIPIFNYYRVFNINDIDGIDSKFTAQENSSVDDIDDVLNKYYENNCSFNIVQGSDQAYYSPNLDQICMPDISQFRSAEAYYSTKFHETIHSTGHKDRLNRIEKNAFFGSEKYSKEELCAELGSSFLCSHFGIDNNSTFENSSAYIQAWVKVLSNDKSMILKASSLAQKAVDFILNVDKESEVC